MFWNGHFQCTALIAVKRLLTCSSSCCTHLHSVTLQQMNYLTYCRWYSVLLDLLNSHHVNHTCSCSFFFFFSVKFHHHMINEPSMSLVRCHFTPKNCKWNNEKPLCVLFYRTEFAESEILCWILLAVLLFQIPVVEIMDHFCSEVTRTRQNKHLAHSVVRSGLFYFK